MAAAHPHQRRLPRHAAHTVLAVTLLWLAAIAASAPAEAALRLTPESHLDPLDQPRSPLDLRNVSFGQQDTLLQLRIRTFADWPARDLEGTGGRRLCLTITPAKGSGGELCVVQRAGRPELEFTPRAGEAAVGSDAGGATAGSDAGGATVGPAQEPIAALVGRPDDRTVLASFPPSAIALPAGAFTWKVTSRWTDDAAGCPATAPCVDTAPDAPAEPAPTFTAVAGVLIQPRCFGAASRDAGRPCVNPVLRTAVEPTPSDATITPNAYCAREPGRGLVQPCSFGLPRAPGRPTILLAGDSHASHWRAAVEVVAQARGWHAISLTHSGCPFTANPTGQTPARNATCKRWFSGVRAWITQHPEVRTLITSSHTLTDTPARRTDYRRTWARLPRTLNRVFVIRDTARNGGPQVACMNHAIAVRQPAGMRCSQPRSTSVPPDPNAAAARESGQTRVKVIDLTRFFCGRQRCLPVVGGALVRKDEEHMTSAFSTTLGPYLLQAISGYGAPQG